MLSGFTYYTIPRFHEDKFRWERYREFGAHYYDALYEFNQRQVREREERINSQEEEVVEAKEEARQRLLFSRVTMQAKSEIRDAVLFEVKLVLVKTGIVEAQSSGVSPESISPGEVPLRLGGKKPKCFFALLKSFLGTTIMGFPAEPAPDRFIRGEE